MDKELTKDEKSLLMFLEYTAVDQWGIIDDPRKINSEDLDIMKKWNDEGFVLSKRVSRDRNDKLLTYAVKLSDEAWKVAHKLRKEKSLRHIPEELIN